MKAHLENYNTGWFGLSLELSSKEIDHLITHLSKLKNNLDHFHFRSDFEGDGGIGDIEISCSGKEESRDLILDGSPPIWPDDDKI